MKNLLAFGSGLIIGGLFSWYASKKYFDKKCDEEYERIYENVYADVDDDLRELQILKKKYSDLEKSQATEYYENSRNTVNDKVVEKEEEKKNVFVQENKELQSGFEEVYDEEIEDEFVENEEDEEEDVEISQADLDAFEEHQRNKNRPPEFISKEAFKNMPSNIDKEALYYYTRDNVLVNDAEEEIENPIYFVGTLFDEHYIDEDVVYIMNYALETCYEVIISKDSYWNPTY